MYGDQEHHLPAWLHYLAQLSHAFSVIAGDSSNSLQYQVPLSRHSNYHCLHVFCVHSWITIHPINTHHTEHSHTISPHASVSILIARCYEAGMEGLVYRKWRGPGTLWYHECWNANMS